MMDSSPRPYTQVEVDYAAMHYAEVVVWVAPAITCAGCGVPCTRYHLRLIGPLLRGLTTVQRASLEHMYGGPVAYLCPACFNPAISLVLAGTARLGPGISQPVGEVETGVED